MGGLLGLRSSSIFTFFMIFVLYFINLIVIKIMLIVIKIMLIHCLIYDSDFIMVVLFIADI